MFVVGRRRMAARLETGLTLSVVPFSAKRFNAPPEAQACSQ